MGSRILETVFPFINSLHTHQHTYTQRILDGSGPALSSLSLWSQNIDRSKADIAIAPKLWNELSVEIRECIMLLSTEIHELLNNIVGPKRPFLPVHIYTLFCEMFRGVCLSKNQCLLATVLCLQVPVLSHHLTIWCDFYCENIIAEGMFWLTVTVFQTPCPNLNHMSTVLYFLVEAVGWLCKLLHLLWILLQNLLSFWWRKMIKVSCYQRHICDPCILLCTPC